MKALFLAIIALFQISCVSTVRSNVDGEMYYKVSIPVALSLSPAAVVEAGYEVYQSSQEATTDYHDNLTQEEANKMTRAFAKEVSGKILRASPVGYVQTAATVLQVSQVVLAVTEAGEKSTEEKLAELDNDKSFSGLIQKLKIIWSNPK